MFCQELILDKRDKDVIECWQIEIEMLEKTSLRSNIYQIWHRANLPGYCQLFDLDGIEFRDYGHGMREIPEVHEFKEWTSYTPAAQEKFLEHIQGLFNRPVKVVKYKLKSTELPTDKNHYGFRLCPDCHYKKEQFERTAKLDFFIVRDVGTKDWKKFSPEEWQEKLKNLEVKVV